MSGPQSKVVVVRVTGPLAPFAGGVRVDADRRWLHARQLDAAGLTGQRVEQYLAERRAAGYTAYCSRTSLPLLWELLALHGASLGGSPTVPVSRADVLLAGYSRFLREERALAWSTTAAYVARARRFLAEGVGEHAMGEVGSADVIGAVLRESTARLVGSTQFFVGAFLRSCYQKCGRRAARCWPVSTRRRSALTRGGRGRD